jgi:hypothetical protein
VGESIIKALQPLAELAIKKSSTSAEKLLCMVKSYEYRYRAQDIGSNKPSQMQRRNRSMKAPHPCPHPWNDVLTADCSISLFQLCTHISFSGKFIANYFSDKLYTKYSLISVTGGNVTGKLTTMVKFKQLYLATYSIRPKGMYTVTLGYLFSKHLI